MSPSPSLPAQPSALCCPHTNFNPRALRSTPAQSEGFRTFVQLCVKGFLAVRRRVDMTMAAINCMADSGLPCFKFAKTLTKLRARFQPDLSEAAAAAYFRDQVLRAYNRTTTIIYDGIQKLQNDIFSDSWK